MIKIFSNSTKLLVLFFSLFIISGNIIKAQEITLSEAVKLDDGFQFTEGPVWKDGALLFSDIDGNKIYRWHPDSGTTVFLDPAGGSNGLALDLDGRLIIAGHRSRNLQRMEDDGTITVLADSFDNKKFNSPNDIAIKSDGSIFFTDPPWGFYPQPGELGYAGIYRYSPNGEVQLLDNTLAFPNGLAFSPDESLLYVDESATGDTRIFVWDVVDDTTLANKREFAGQQPHGGFDGMKTDSSGRLYGAGADGITVFDTDGNLLDNVTISGQTTNCNWGSDQSVLYVTSGGAIYRIDVTKNVTDVKTEFDQGKLDKTFKLYDLYPNPFNAETKINFYVGREENVKISIFDTIGKEVDIVTNQQFLPGEYRLSWNSSEFSSGIYFVQMATLSGTDTKKLMLIK